MAAEATSPIGGIAVAAGLAVVLAGLSAAWLAWAARHGRLDRTVKRRITAGARSLAGLTIDFDVIDFSPFSGRLGLANLIVANPEGYASLHALTCPDVRVSVAPHSLLAGPVVFRSILLKNPEISFEARSRANNLSDLRAGLDRACRDPLSARTAGPYSPSRPGRKIVIDRFEMTGARLRLGLTALGPLSVSIPFPDLRLDGVGREEGGLEPSWALAGLVGAAVERAVDMAGAYVESKTRESARRLGDRLKTILTG